MDTPTQYIAQFSWGALRAPADDPSVAPFFEGIPSVHARADANPGFVWRCDGERAQGEAAGWKLFDNDRIITSFSVWKTPEALRDFIYKGAHGAFYSRRSDWFDRTTRAGTSSGGSRRGRSKPTTLGRCSTNLPPKAPQTRFSRSPIWLKPRTSLAFVACRRKDEIKFRATADTYPQDIDRACGTG